MCEYACHYSGEDNNDASFSSVTAESLGLSDNGFKRPKKQLESSNIIEIGYRAAGEGEGS